MESSLDPKIDLPEVWEGFVREYCSITHLSLPRNADVGKLQANLDVALGTAANGNDNRARVIIKNVSQCLQRFGDVMATTASLVFGPSAQCWNAISFMLSAVQKYQGLFDGFVVLLERSSVFFSRLATFLEDNDARLCLPPHLRRAIYQILGHFLKVIANAYKVTHSKREKLKLFAGVVMFADESTVQADLDSMERLVQNLLHVEVDEILRDVKDLARFLRDSDNVRHRFEVEIMETIQEADTKWDARWDAIGSSIIHIRKVQHQDHTEREHQVHLARIKATLLVDQSECYQEQHKKLRSSRLPGTGKWLLQNPVFKRWCSVHKPELDLITLVGDEGYGKSYICSHVVDHLTARQSTDAPAVVAYHYSPPNVSEAKLEGCIGSLIFPIAKADKVYARAAAEVCNNAGSLTRATTLWSRLIEELQGSMAGTYFLVIAGLYTSALEPDAKAFIKRITTQPLSLGCGNKVRLFLATDDRGIGLARGCRILLGTPHWDEMQSLQRTAFLPRTGHHASDDERKTLVNSSDLLLFTATHVEEIGEDPDFRAMAMDPEINIVSTLVESVRGDYVLLLSTMKEVQNCDTDQAVKEPLSRAQEGRVQSVRRRVGRLDQTLTQEELEVLTEILTWVLAGFTSISIQLLQAVLLMARGTRYYVRAKVTSRFSGFLRFDEFGNVRSVYNAKDLHAALLSTATDETSPTIVSVLAISPDEISFIKHLLQTNCDADLFERLHFEEVFFDRTSTRTRRLRLLSDSEQNAHLLRMCLECLCTSTPEPELCALRSYAQDHFVHHLLEVDLQNPQKMLLQYLGHKIATTLWDTELIDGWYKSGQPRWQPIHVIFFDSQGKSFIELLGHPFTKEGYSTSTEQHQWLRSTMMHNGPPARVLSRVALRLGSRYMCAETADPYYFEQGEEITSRAWLRDGDHSESIHFAKCEGVCRFVEWLRAQHPCHLRSPNAWAERRVRILRHYGFHPEAIDTIKHLEPLTDDAEGVRTLIQVAACHESAGRPAYALEVLATAREAFRRLRNAEPQNHVHDRMEQTIQVTLGQLSSASKLASEEMHQALLLEEGKCHYACGNLEQATERLRLVIRADIDAAVTNRTSVERWGAETLTEAFEARELLVQLFHGNEQWQAVIDEVLAWSERHAAQAFAYRTDQHRRLFQTYVVEAAWSTGRWKQIDALYETATNDLRDMFDGIDTEQLRSVQAGRALLLFHCSDEPADHEMAVALLEHDVEIRMRNLDHFHEGYQLALFLLQKARDEHDTQAITTNPGSYERRLEKLASLEVPCCTSIFRSALARLYVRTRRKQQARDLLSFEVELWLNGRAAEEAIPGNTNGESLARNLRSIDDRSNAVACHLRLWPLDRPFEGRVNVLCKGNCGSVDARNLYWCLDCHDTMLCPDCHRKVKDGDLFPLICSKTHDHIHVTPEHVEKKAALGKDVMLVDGNAVPFAQWLDNLRMDWKLDPDSIREREERRKREYEASASIARWWRKNRTTA